MILRQDYDHKCLEIILSKYIGHGSILLIISSYSYDIIFSHLHMQMKASGVHRFPPKCEFKTAISQKLFKISESNKKQNDQERKPLHIDAVFKETILGLLGL